MRKRIIGCAVGAALLGGGLLAGMSLAGSDEAGEPRAVVAPAVLEPITGVPARASQARRGKRRKPTIDFYYSRTPLVPTPAESVQPIRCPRGAGDPIGGGARTAQGIVVAYLSRVHPETGRTPPRTYFVGVEDVSDTNDPGAGALIEVQCAKGMRVKK